MLKINTIELYFYGLVNFDLSHMKLIKDFD